MHNPRHRCINLRVRVRLKLYQAEIAFGTRATFRCGREFTACLGLVPRQTGSGARIRQRGLSRRGNTYLRTLLVHGARLEVLRGRRTPWLDDLLARRPFNVVVPQQPTNWPGPSWPSYSAQPDMRRLSTRKNCRAAAHFRW
ncbi:transposase [Pandoraea oxalativorans]|uniref:transposase n=1 Tax=Pandoraea oxalativorans TaxID=573737 RepID=UPI003CCBFAC2